MFTSIRARIVALCVAIAVVALAANAVRNNLVANPYSAAAINSTLSAIDPTGRPRYKQAAAAMQSQAVSLASAVTQLKLD
jgi:methyl-accepting chemotaxis protein